MLFDSSRAEQAAGVQPHVRVGPLHEYVQLTRLRHDLHGLFPLNCINKRPTWDLLPLTGALIHTTAAPFLRYGKYCGILYSGCPGEPPCDALDACCMHHDNCVQAKSTLIIHPSGSSSHNLQLLAPVVNLQFDDTHARTHGLLMTAAARALYVYHMQRTTWARRATRRCWTAWRGCGRARPRSRGTSAWSRRSSTWSRSS